MSQENNKQTILIVGNGQAAATAVQTLRSQGFAGRIRVVGSEAHLAYERPPLSKGMLSDPNADLPGLHIHSADFYQDAGIDLMLQKTVVQIDTGRNVAFLEDGQQLSYDYCLIATGGQARQLPDYPCGNPHIHYLRTADDALKLKRSLNASSRVVIIGGGFLGMELASTTRTLGAIVDVIEAADSLLARNAPALFSTWLAQRARQAGVTLHLGAKIHEATLQKTGPTDAPVTLSLDNGCRLEADHLIVAVGLTPNIEVGSRSGLTICAQTGGIQIDHHGRTSMPNVFAAGDCATRVNLETGKRVRIESWQNANEQARIAAQAMLGQTPAAAALPWFWTDQFECNIQMLGATAADLQFVQRGEIDANTAAPKFLLLGIRDSIPRYALAVNAGADLRALRPLLEKEIPIDPEAFTDLDLPVKQFAKNTTAAAH